MEENLIMEDENWLSLRLFPPDDLVDRLADWNQLLLCRSRTKLLQEESGVGPRQTEGVEWFDMTDMVISYVL